MDRALIATLKVNLPGQQEQIVSLRDGQSIKLGRDAGNDVVLDDAGVSRVHATLSASSKGLVVADLSSLNGTFVNGERLDSMRDLSSNDIVDIGAAKITVQLKGAEVVDSLSGGGSSRAMTAQLKPVSVTVLVATVRKFDVISREIETKDVVEMLLGWKTAVSTAVSECKGEIDKVIENRVVAIWMGSDAGELAKQALQAMHKIQKVGLDLVNEGQWSRQQDFPWQASVVLSSGHGLTGATGASSSTEEPGFTIVGDPINHAFALESYIEKLGSLVLIDEPTAELIKDEVSLVELGDVGIGRSGEELKLFSV